MSTTAPCGPEVDTCGKSLPKAPDVMWGVGKTWGGPLTCHVVLHQAVAPSKLLHVTFNAKHHNTSSDHEGGDGKLMV